MRSERAIVLIVASRGLSEAVTFAVLATFLHAGTVGKDPIPLWTASLAIFGVTLVLTSILRERGTVRQSTGLAVVVIGAGAAWGLTLEARSPDALAVLSRIVGFGIAAEWYLWRALGIARGLQRWREVRNGALLALGTIVVASLVPGPVDRSALPGLALLVAVVGAVALSLARATEELALATGQVRGRPAASPATGTAFALGMLAVGAALALPTAQVLLGEVARIVGPVLGEAVFLILLPLGYVAAYLVYLALWLRELLRPTGVEIRPPAMGLPAADDPERIREVEQLRPIVFGALEVLIALIAVGFAVALVARLVQERRALLPSGASLDRERVEGIGLGATLGALFPRRITRAGPPPDDGTAAAAIRRLYWRLLELAERAGPGWREPAETPAEHEARLVATAARWREAEPIVRAFEALRYGEREPDPATVADARAALRRVEGTS